MAALTFDKNELGNLEYSLKREMLATDRRGGYMSTTIVCCNTRKYHGLIVAPIDESDNDYVLLSSLDETIVHDGYRFNLAIHRFAGTYEPRGNKYITDFEYTPTPTITYRIGDLVLKKELLWIHRRTQLMVRYTLIESNVPEVTLQLRPFLGFRNRHELSKANMHADGHSYPVVSGVKCRLYETFPWLYMQLSNKNFEYVPAPDWYYGFEYPEELARGYEGHEDLLTPGYFELQLKKGESVTFSASTDEMFSGDVINEAYDISVKRRTHKVDFMSCLHHSARQFIVRRGDGHAEVEAGYPWYGVVGREALFALPGLTLGQKHEKDCMDVLDHIIKQINSGDIPVTYDIYHAVDTPLWFFRTLQMLESRVDRKKIWKMYAPTIKSILDLYRNGVGDRVWLHDNGLIWSWTNEAPVAWIDPTVDTSSISPRNGYLVEVQALWYNALCYALSLAEEFGDKELIEKWGDVPAKTKASFIEKFWNSETGYLNDNINDNNLESDMHPNALIACALDYKMLADYEVIEVIQKTKQYLLTPKGVRSISPESPLYGKTKNNNKRGGSVWVWPLALYVKACFDVSGKNFLEEAKAILAPFEEEIQLYGIGSISERFDADPPHAPRGAISQAWSVAAILEIVDLIIKYKDDGKSNVEVIKVPAKPRTRAAKSTTATKPAAAKKTPATKKAPAAKKATAEKAAVKKSTTTRTRKPKATVTEE